jgi:UDP-N-acetylglucosamine 2-epimerase
MKKIVTIVGARPQFIKVAPVSRVLRTAFQEVLVHTGQHYDHKMAGVFFEQLQIPMPDYDLSVGSGNHGQQTGEMIIKIEEVLLKEKPDAVLVYGDTNSTLAGSIAASKLHIPIFHIEAGLRSFNRIMPEEINRVLTDHVSSLLFAPTNLAVDNLKKEGISQGVHNVGDVMCDAVYFNAKIADEQFTLETFGLESSDYILATIHRAENTDDRVRLEAIFKSLNKLNYTVVLPLHPRTEKILKEQGLFDLVEKSTNIKIIEPAPYLEMLFLEKHAKAIVTDSGGVQKEAYFAHVPCFTLRDQTEWVETVEIGWNQLVNPVSQDLSLVIDNYQPKPYVENLYGSGDAASIIVETMKNFFE